MVVVGFILVMLTNRLPSDPVPSYQLPATQGQGFHEGIPVTLARPDPHLPSNAQIAADEAEAQARTFGREGMAAMKGLVENMRSALNAHEGQHASELREEDVAARFDPFNTNHPLAPLIVENGGCMENYVSPDEAALMRMALGFPVSLLLEENAPIQFQRNGTPCVPEKAYREALKDTPLGDVSLEAYVNRMEIEYQNILMQHPWMYEQIELLGLALDRRVARESGVDVSMSAGALVEESSEPTRFQSYITRA